jgi:hypothetical protein
MGHGEERILIAGGRRSSEDGPAPPVGRLRTSDDPGYNG